MDQRAHEIKGLLNAFPFIPKHETSRLVLRELRADTRSFLALKAPARQARAFMNIRNDAEWLQEKMKAKQGLQSYSTNICWFQIFDKETELGIGSCGYHNWNFMHRRAEIGYSLIDDVWKRRGFMTEALQFAINFGFNQLYLHRIEACIGPWNEASIALINKFGFQKEGLLRQHYVKNGIAEDSVLYSLLQPDYQGLNE